MDVTGVVLAFVPDAARTTGTPAALRLLDGLPLIAHAALALRESGVVVSTVVLVPPAATAEQVTLLAAALAGPDLHLAAGSPADACPAAGEIVVVHDAGRPLAPADLVVRVVAAVRDGADAAVPVLEVTETVKELDADGRITRTVPRETLVRLQAPWAVRRSLLDAVLTPDGVRVPSGPGVVTVEGADDAFPVRTGPDLDLAAAVLAGRAR